MLALLSCRTLNPYSPNSIIGLNKKKGRESVCQATTCEKNMRHIKSERLKKLESELVDLQQWLKLGLVPKKDVQKHKEEIQALQIKIEEEKDRLAFLKESGEGEDFVVPKKAQGRSAYTEMPTIPDIDMHEGTAGGSDSHFDMETEAGGYESEESDDDDDSEADDNETAADDEDDESYFSDRNRWKRGGILDPDANEW